MTVPLVAPNVRNANCEEEELRSTEETFGFNRKNLPRRTTVRSPPTLAGQSCGEIGFMEESHFANAALPSAEEGQVRRKNAETALTQPTTHTASLIK